MELQEFIRGTIVAIVGGVTGAAEDLKETAALVNPPFEGSTRHLHHTALPVQIVGFDVAVHAGDKDKVSGGIGIFVGSIAFGGKAATEVTSGSTSRITFEIPLYLPTETHHDKQQAKEAEDEK